MYLCLSINYPERAPPPSYEVRYSCYASRASKTEAMPLAKWYLCRVTPVSIEAYTVNVEIGPQLRVRLWALFDPCINLPQEPRYFSQTMRPVPPQDGLLRHSPCTTADLLCRHHKGYASTVSPKHIQIRSFHAPNPPFPGADPCPQCASRHLSYLRIRYDPKPERFGCVRYPACQFQMFFEYYGHEMLVEETEGNFSNPARLM